MCRLFETIRIVDGVPRHIAWHEERMNLARKELWGADVPIVLATEIMIPAELSAGIARCRITYGPGIREVSYRPYEKRLIHSLKMVRSARIDYHLKFCDRTVLDTLFEQRGACDEIIIVRNGRITDTSMSNLVFYDGTAWYTPATPLLEGTCRNRLIAEGWLAEADIRPADLRHFRGCKLINAMREPGDEEMIPVANIV